MTQKPPWVVGHDTAEQVRCTVQALERESCCLIRSSRPNCTFQRHDGAWSGARELVDTGATAEQVEEISNTIAAVEGVEDFHDLKTRRMGQSILVDVHVLVGSQVTVSEGHMTADRVRAALHERCKYVSDVLVHVDPEDDTTDAGITLLPSREEMLRRLDRRWREAGIEIVPERVNFHYLGGVVDVEILLPLEGIDGIHEARRLSRRLEEATRLEQQVGTIDVLFR